MRCVCVCVCVSSFILWIFLIPGRVIISTWDLFPATGKNWQGFYFMFLYGNFGWIFRGLRKWWGFFSELSNFKQTLVLLLLRVDFWPVCVWFRKNLSTPHSLIHSIFGFSFCDAFCWWGRRSFNSTKDGIFGHQGHFFTAAFNANETVFNLLSRFTKFVETRSK